MYPVRFPNFFLITGANRFYDNKKGMIGYRPSPVIKSCWLFFTPATCFVDFLFIFSSHLHTFLKEERLLLANNESAFLVFQNKCLNKVFLFLMS